MFSNVTDGDALKLITVILSVASCVGPIVFGYVIYRMNQLFVGKSEFNEYKTDNRERLLRIETDVKELLKKTG